MAQNNNSRQQIPPNPNVHQRQSGVIHASSYFLQPTVTKSDSSPRQTIPTNRRCLGDTEQQCSINNSNIPKTQNSISQQSQPHQVPSKMAEPFSASTAFTNNNNNDGWGEDWGDWGDNSNGAVPQKGQLPPQQQVAPQQPVSTNQYFQQAPQQYPPRQTPLDQSNRNFMPSVVPGGHQQLYDNYSAPSHPSQPQHHQHQQHQQQQQQHFQPSYQAYPPQQPPQQQQQYSQAAPAPTSFFNQPPQRPPSHPPASVTPQHTQHPSYNQTISDSFNTSAGDSWNWGVPDNQPAPSPRPQTVEQKHPPNTFQDTYHQGYPQPTVSPNNFSLPGGANNTQQLPQPPKIQPAQIARLKNETLSPQWSIESQVSQTSSDRSIDSGEIGESRSSNTDDGSSGKQGPARQVENCENIGPYRQYTGVGDVLDKLDEAINYLNIKQESNQTTQEENRADQYRESSFPPPPPSIATNQQVEGAVLPPKSSSRTPPLPPPPTETASNTAQAPPPLQAPPTTQGPPKAAGNPFKRAGQRTHITTPGLTIQPSAPANPNFFYQPQEVTNVENPIPENQEIPDSRTENVENLEIAPSNDRNQYLQTGHLSEEGYTVSQPSNDQQLAEDNLPPPGLSRYVPGQQQSENIQQPGSHSFPEPPPGLDRMVPGTDLENVADLNMERQVDGEVSDSASNANSNVRTSFIPAPTSQAEHHHHHIREEVISDRNLYLVPGESDAHHAQRVIPGVEDDRPSQTTGSNYAQQMPVVQHPVDVPINEQERELVMDGENPHDPPQPMRDEPIEGGNTLDDPIASSHGTMAIGMPDAESSLTVDAAKKDPSNTSTADESDKDRSMFYPKGKPSRRDEDPLRRSTKSKSSRDRYDTEDSDYSDRERRRREGENSGGADGHNRDRRRGGGGAEREKEKDHRKESGRDRDRERDRNYDYRDKERNRYDRDRYGRNSKYDRESRYETDGSKYETERSTRYEKDGDGGKHYISREEYHRKREERGGEDRRYRKEKDRERGDRYRDDRRKDDRYREGGEKRRDRHDRRYDYEDYRTASRNGTERDRERDRARDSRERDDRKDRDRKYPPSAYGAQYGTSGYYDPYSYYTQHQQYYEQLRRTNPQAYAEWYRTYYSQMQATQMQRDLMTSDGRESVHSGRSSANDKERFNRTTPFLRQPGMYNPEDYHRHFNNQSHPSAILDQSFLSEASGQPTSLPLYQHQQAMAAAATFQQQQQQRATPLVMDRSYHTDSGYYQPRLDNTDGSLRQDTSAMEVMEPERLTPRKFPEIHPIVSVSCGLLVSAKNRLTINGPTDVVKIMSLGVHEPTRKLFQSYPGPLGKERTHKKSVIEFCEEQLRIGPPCSSGHAIVKSRGNSINSLHSLGANVNRGSYTLLWNYIILLLRQNGTFVGTDISELLMQNKIQFPFESHQASIRSTNVSGRNSSLSMSERKPRELDADGGMDAEDEEGPEKSENISSELDQQSLAEKKEQLTEQEITDKFRNYLIYGNISDALEWATENNLWGHALFLASKVDSRQHANVMMKFANKLTLNDPLQTLYQLLSGRTPSAVSCVQDEKWGDWRPHLAMLMSNSQAKPELIKKSITTLGDSLYNRGDLYAAHFCYLLSDVTFGRFSEVKHDAGPMITVNTMVRLILLGSAHFQRTFKEFSTNESIMMTEIYEYARSLNEDRYSIIELQYYKYLLASRMLDHGMQLKCLLYMEQIAEQIQLDPYRFDYEFIKKVYTLGDRLKYYDPVLEKALDESVDNNGQGNIYSNVEDPAWLVRLSAILNNYNTSSASNHLNQMNYGGAGQDNTNSQYGSYTGYGGEQMPQQQAHALGKDNSYSAEPADINKQFAEINQQLGQLNLQYTETFDQPPQPTPTHHKYDNQIGAPSYDQGYDSINQSSLPDDAQMQQQHQQHESFDQQQSQQEHQQQHLQQQQQPQQAYTYNYDGSDGMPNMFVPPSNPDMQQSNPYGYWGANAEMPQPSISMPNAVSQRPGYDEDDSPKRAAPGGLQQHKQAPEAQSKPGGGDQAKKGQPAAKDAKGPINNQSNSGWFGGIWNKLSLKPKNQMILPDDKNPTIVWDPEKKRWVNTEAGEAEEEAFKPPPKMAELMPSGGGAQPPPQPASTPAPPIAMASPVGGGGGGYGAAPVPDPAGYAAPGHGTVPQPSTVPTAGPKVGEPTKVPTLQSNMFKMQRNRTLKKSYVDVFNPSGAAPSRPAEPILAPAVPTIAAPQGGFFVPGPAPIGSNASEAAPEGMPQFYNPNQFAGGYQQ